MAGRRLSFGNSPPKERGWSADLVDNLGERVKAVRLWGTVAVAFLLSGCAAGPLWPGPVRARSIEGWSLSIENPQRSRVWTFTGFRACVEAVPTDLSFDQASLVGVKGQPTVRGGLSATLEKSGLVAPLGLPANFDGLAAVRPGDVPVTGCPDPAQPVQFGFEVTSDTSWSADGFQVDYRAGGVAYTLVWQMPVSVCAPSGCPEQPE